MAGKNKMVWYLQSEVQEAVDPLWEDVVTVLTLLLPVDGNYLILEAPDREDGCLYIQTLLEQEKGKDGGVLHYLVETRFEQVNEAGEKEFAHYATHREHLKDVIELFSQYYLRKTVDVTGWKNITQKLKQRQEKKEHQ